MSDINAAWREKRRWRWMKPIRNLHIGPKLPETPIEELQQDFAADIAALRRRLRCEIATLKAELKLRRLLRVIKAYNPGQPRDDHGRWTSGSGASLRPASRIRPAGIGHNLGPPLEEPPPIPKERPPTTQAKNAIVKATARYFLRVSLGLARGPVGALALAIEATAWLDGDRARIESYQDPPKSLEDLQQAVSEPRWGYDIHHVVEQTPAKREGFPSSLIHGPENLVRIPTLKHWEINGWYNTPNGDYEGLTPRQYLNGKDWDKRTEVGRSALIKFGVLKP